MTSTTRWWRDIIHEIRQLSARRYVGATGNRRRRVDTFYWQRRRSVEIELHAARACDAERRCQHTILQVSIQSADRIRIYNQAAVISINNRFSAGLAGATDKLTLNVVCRSCKPT